MIFFLLAVSSLIKQNISSQRKNSRSSREQDDQGRAMQESTVTPASVGRGGDNHSSLPTGWWPSDQGKVVSQGTKDSERCLVSTWASAEHRAGHGPTRDVSQVRARTGVGVCVGQGWGPRGGYSVQLQCFGALAR